MGGQGRCLMLLDLACEWRSLLRARSYSLGMISVIALAVAINSAVLAVVAPALIEPLPFAASGASLVSFREVNRSGQNPTLVAPRDFPLLNRLPGLSSVAAYVHGPEIEFTVAGAETNRRLPGAIVSGDFFSTLGANAALGRALGPADDLAGAPRTIVLSNALWARQFSADARAIGKRIELNGRDYLVVGIMPASFQFPANAMLWIARPHEAYQALGRSDILVPSYGVIGRMRPGVSLRALQHQAALLHPAGTSGSVLHFRVASLRDQLYGSVRAQLILAWVVAGCFLVIACADLASLAATRWGARRSEVALRAALGGGRIAALRPAIFESVILAAAGAALGGLLGSWITAWYRSMAPPALRLGTPISALEMAAILVPLVLAIHLAAALATVRREMRGAAPAQGLRVGRARFGAILAVAQIALTIGFVAAGGVAALTLIRALWTKPGFAVAPSHLLVADIDLPALKYPTPAAQNLLFSRMLHRVAALPGIAQAAWASQVPVRDGAFVVPVRVRRDGRAVVSAADCFVVSRSYFGTIGLRPNAGRSWESDVDRGVIVNADAARKFWGDESPMGQWISFAPPGSGPGSWRRVIGVAPSVLVDDPDGNAQIYALFDEFPIPSSSRTLLIRSAKPAAVVPELRRVAEEIAPTAPLEHSATLAAVIATRLAPQQLAAAALGLVALVGLALVTMGTFALAGYLFRCRELEFAVRLALGAPPASVRSLVLASAGAWMLLGTGFGAILLYLIAGGLRALGATSSGLTAVVVFLAATLVNAAVLAGCIPSALQAARTPPAGLLRCR